jgi:phospholipid-binding lipoprotein MlaA
MLVGCASGPNPRDPYESFNRKMYAFNETLDKAVLKPVAKGYEWAMPDVARTGVTNFFRNLDVVRTVLNQVAQGRIPHAIEDSARFATNVVFGLGGLIDVASDMNFPRRREDFGQTLGYWGFKGGPYIVLPLLGSSNVRDALAFPVDFFSSPSVAWAENSTVTWTLIGINVVNQRAILLPAEKFIEQTGLDRYDFLRDAYVQNREYQIHNGMPPATPGEARPKTLLELEEEDFGDEPAEP